MTAYTAEVLLLLWGRSGAAIPPVSADLVSDAQGVRAIEGHVAPERSR